MGPVLHPRVPPQRGAARATTWWGKAWVRAVEEAAYADADLVAARRLARAGHVGRIATEAGRWVASVDDTHGLWTVEGSLPVLDREGRAALVEVVAADSGRITSLLAGDLPYELVEQAEELGVELLPDGPDLSASCACDHWADPCVHALAVLAQLGWLVDADPLTLLALRGLPRDELAAGLHVAPGTTSGPGERDLDLAVEAALYVERMLDDGPVSPAPAAPPAPSG